MPSMGNTAAVYHNPADAAARAVNDAVTTALDLGVHPASVATAVANGLTGELNGYRARALARAIADAYDALADVPLEDLKAAERQARR